MTHHILKLDLEFWSAVESGRKPFEIRLNDRGYKAGDTVEFRAYNHRFQEYMKSYEPMFGEITYITSFCQRDGFVVFMVKLQEENSQ